MSLQIVSHTTMLSDGPPTLKNDQTYSKHLEMEQAYFRCIETQANNFFF